VSLFWAEYTYSWGFTLAPYVVLAAFSVLLVLWAVHARLRLYKWTCEIQDLSEIDLTSGRAPKVMPDTTPQSQWRKDLTSVLNFI